MRHRILTALATVAVLLTVCQTASAAAYNLVGWYQRSGGGNLSSLAFKAGVAQGCPNSGADFIQPCYAPTQPWTVSNNVIDQVDNGLPTFDWTAGAPGIGTLTVTGLFWGTSFINSNPLQTTVISDKVTNLVVAISAPGVGTTTATAYDCIEGTFLPTVGVNGCENQSLGLNGIDNTVTVYNAGGNEKCVTQAISPDDFSLSNGGYTATLSYNALTTAFTVGKRIKGQSSGTFGTITAITISTATTGTLTLISVAGANFANGNFQAGEIIKETELPAGSATVASVPALGFVTGDPEPRGITTVAAGAEGVGCVKTGGAFDLWHVAVDDGTYLILSESADLGTCYLYGTERDGGCESLGSGSYMVFAKPTAPDTDGDGNYDFLDNCSAVVNPGQEDADADAIGDVCDPDDDGDTIADGADICPLNYDPLQVDTDGDGRSDVCDNCRLVSNMLVGLVPGTAVAKAQLDPDLDGYGSRCDGDVNNSQGANGQVNTTDYTVFRSVINKLYTVSNNAAKSDLNGSGTVDTTDYTIFRSLINKVPGPSAYCGPLPVPVIAPPNAVPNVTCPAPRCGDGTRTPNNGYGTPAEQCDDGNNTDGDGCSSICRVE